MQELTNGTLNFIMPLLKYFHKKAQCVFNYSSYYNAYYVKHIVLTKKRILRKMGEKLNLDLERAKE